MRAPEYLQRIGAPTDVIAADGADGDAPLPPRRHAVAHVSQLEGRCLVLFPVRSVAAEVSLVTNDADANNLVGEAELLMEFQRAGMDAHGARLLAGAVLSIDDAKRHTPAGQREPKNQSRWARTDNEDGGGPVVASDMASTP